MLIRKSAKWGEFNLVARQGFALLKKDAPYSEGTYASVYLGKQIVTGRKIAIKKVRARRDRCESC